MTTFKKYQFSNESKHPVIVEYRWGEKLTIGEYTLAISPGGLTIVDAEENQVILTPEVAVFIQDYVKIQERRSPYEVVGEGVDKAGQAGWVPGQGGFTQVVAEHLLKMGVLDPGWKDRENT